MTSGDAKLYQNFMEVKMTNGGDDKMKVYFRYLLRNKLY